MKTLAMINEHYLHWLDGMLGKIFATDVKNDPNKAMFYKYIGITNYVPEDYENTFSFAKEKAELENSIYQMIEEISPDLSKPVYIKSMYVEIERKVDAVFQKAEAEAERSYIVKVERIGHYGGLVAARIKEFNLDLMRLNEDREDKQQDLDDLMKTQEYLKETTDEKMKNSSEVQ